MKQIMHERKSKAFINVSLLQVRLTFLLLQQSATAIFSQQVNLSLSITDELTSQSILFFGCYWNDTRGVEECQSTKNAIPMPYPPF